MAARKAKRYFPRRQRRPTNDSNKTDPRIAIEARRLAENQSVEELQAHLAQAQEACDMADREAQERPSGYALQAYRSAANALAAAQEAVEIATGARARS